MHTFAFGSVLNTSGGACAVARTEAAHGHGGRVSWTCETRTTVRAGLKEADTAHCNQNIA